MGKNIVLALSLLLLASEIITILSLVDNSFERNCNNDSLRLYVEECSGSSALLRIPGFLKLSYGASIFIRFILWVALFVAVTMDAAEKGRSVRFSLLVLFFGGLGGLIYYLIALISGDGSQMRKVPRPWE